MGSVTYAVFENGGAGYFAEAGETDEDAWVLKDTCSWAAADSKNTYTLAFADGAAETAVLDAEHGLMTMSDGCVLEKQASEMSGVVLRTVKMLPLKVEVEVEQAR